MKQSSLANIIHAAVFGVGAFLACGGTAHAAALSTYCAYSTQEKKATGENLDKATPIASVSKIFTSQWALAQLGPDYKFETRIHVTPVAGATDVYNVHVEGAQDPYFSNESLHLMVSELVKLGVKRVKTFSFDENFKFFWNVRSNSVAIMERDSSFPQPSVVESQLKGRSFLHDYNTTRIRFKALKVDLVANPDLEIEEKVFLEKKQFVANQKRPTTKVYKVKSSPLIELLKEMNRNSNNVAANILFEKLGGISAHETFWKKFVAGKKTGLRMLNGSGGPVFVGEMKNYNMATCRDVLLVLGSMHDYLSDPSRKFSLADVLSMPGDRDGNVLRLSYSDEALDRTLMAKTGTVCPCVALAGLASTKKGPVLFYFNMKTGPEDGSCVRNYRSEWNAARNGIKNRVIQLIERDFGGGKPEEIHSVDMLELAYEFDGGQ